jgi:hypothetical protein
MLGTPLPLTAIQLFRIAKNRTVAEDPTLASQSDRVAAVSRSSGMSRLTTLRMMGQDQRPEYTEDANIRT